MQTEKGKPNLKHKKNKAADSGLGEDGFSREPLGGKFLDDYTEASDNGETVAVPTIIEEPEQTQSDAQALIEIDGVVTRVVFNNPDNGYSVCQLEGKDKDKALGTITIVGVLPYVGEGETLRAMGKWETHATYGLQFKVEYYEKQLPATSSAIEKYLASRAVKGIGPATAKKLVAKYGEQTFDVIENHPEWLSEFPGISDQKAQDINAAFKLQFGVRAVMMFCRDFFGPSVAAKIYKRWGSNAIDVIKENPYILCDEIQGIGFESADHVARTLGIGENDVRRVKSGLLYLLSYNGVTNGHVFLPRDRLVEMASAMLMISPEDSDTALDGLIAEHKAISVRIESRECIYLEYYYNAEQYIVFKLEQLNRLFVKMDVDDVEKLIDQIQDDFNIKYAKMQRRAISEALNSGVMILTGGPGTGKTTVIKAVLAVFDRIGYKVVLAAPTGRAAKRMSEATSHEARTIHRLLETNVADDRFPRFNRGDDNLLEEDVIIIDEASMVDTILMSALLHAIKPGARLIMIGDADQLPSVGAGNVLNDLIKSDRFSKIELREIFRQASQSLIVVNAHAINSGEEPKLDAVDSDFFFLRRPDENTIAPTVADLCANRLPHSYGEEIRGQIQVITPSRKGPAGTEALNALLQETLNPPDKTKAEHKSRGMILRVGDKVMQIKNNYDLEWTREGGEGGTGVFNGDIGTIAAIDTASQTITVTFDDREAVYDFTMADELDHAFAITVHKSQGSEYPVVVIPVFSYTPKLLTRNLLYTAVTRAQKMVIMVGRREVVSQMIANDRQTLRYTGLAYFLGRLNDDPGAVPAEPPKNMSDRKKSAEDG